MKKEKVDKTIISLREQILQSMRASFKIEGIAITNENAHLALKKVELSLGK